MKDNASSKQLRCLITAGPTREYFDPVRYISNPSSGKMGFAIAAAAQSYGWKTCLITGPVNQVSPQGVDRIDVISSDDMFHMVQSKFYHYDILIKAAAVSDCKPRYFYDKKQKKESFKKSLEIVPTKDILQTICSRKRSNQFVLGFAAETDNLEYHALEKLKRKSIDAIAANYIRPSDNAFGSDYNTLYVYHRNGSKTVIGPLDKCSIAEQLIQWIAKVAVI